MSKQKTWGDGHKAHIQTDQPAPTAAPASPIPPNAAGVWFRLAKVPNSGGCLAVERLDVGDNLAVMVVHQADLRAISLSKVQNFLLEELMR